MSVPLPLTLTASRLGLTAGEVSPAKLIQLDNGAIISLFRSCLNNLSLPQIFSLLSGGTMTVMGYASVWTDRMEFLSFLERLGPVLPKLVDLSDLDLLLLSFNKPEMISALAKSGASLEVLLAALDTLDASALRTALLEVGVGVDLQKMISRGLTPEDAPIVVGAILWDLDLTEVRAQAPLALAFIPPVWRHVLLKAASAAPESSDADLAVELVSQVTDLV